MSTHDQVAFIEVRVFPWRPRPRIMDPNALRESLHTTLPEALGLGEVLVTIALFVVIWIAAPIIVLVLAALLFSFELPLLIALALLFIGARFVGVIPWTIGGIDPQTGIEQRERTRSLIRARRRRRAINCERRGLVRWSWPSIG